MDPVKREEMRKLIYQSFAEKDLDPLSVRRNNRLFREIQVLSDEALEEMFGFLGYVK